MGTYALHEYFKCGGLHSTHQICGGKQLKCATCIQRSVKAGLHPLKQCDDADVYAQIDNGFYVGCHFPQIELLELLMESYPSGATFFLTFRSMDRWYSSICNWPPNKKLQRMNDRLMHLNITGFPAGRGRDMYEFNDWYCKHVMRVREMVAKYPLHALQRQQNETLIQDIPPASLITFQAEGAKNDQSPIVMLAEAIQSDAEQSGLRPISVPVNAGRKVKLRGLDDELVRDVFLGERLFFFGDSTLRNLHMWLHYLLRMNMKDETPFSTMNLTQANRVFLDRINNDGESCQFRTELGTSNGELACKGVPGKHNTMTTILDDGATESAFLGGWGNKCTDFKDEYDAIKNFRPTILVANVGLWWFHFQKRGRERSVCIVDKWLKYEEWLDGILNLAEEAGVEVLLFKTTNLICDEKYQGEMATANDLYSSRDEQTVQKCFRSFRPKTMSATTDADILNYCINGTMNTIGSDHHNQRLLQFVKDRKDATTLKLAVLPDRNIQSCQFTGMLDGRHYHQMNLARIRLLGNVVMSLKVKE
eukprot:scaffold1813_cov185-Alexandrium_tamarense.AAC.9